MKVKIREIARSGMDYDDQATPAELDLLEDYIDAESPVLVSGRLQRVDAFILAKLRVAYSVDTICARCLDPINAEKTMDVELEMGFNPGDEFVDLGSYIREELLIDRRPRMLCREDCRGICPGCGAYLNEEACECDQRIKEQGNA